jgi:hypothetical protein
MVLRASYRAQRDCRDLTFCFQVYRSTDRLRVYDGNFTGEEVGVSNVDAGAEFHVEFQFTAHLTRGTYHIECLIVETPTQTFLTAAAPLGSFSIAEMRTWSGIADLEVSARASRPVLERVGVAQR